MKPTQDPQLDADHDLIIQLMEQLMEQLRLEAAPSPEATEALQRYLEDHCVREERLMSAEGYPALAGHRAAHAALRDGWRDAQDLPRLRRDLLAHIVTWDEAYGVWRAERP